VIGSKAKSVQEHVKSSVKSLAKGDAEECCRSDWVPDSFDPVPGRPGAFPWRGKSMVILPDFERGDRAGVSRWAEPFWQDDLIT
jgi:hypothetical protein